MKFDIKIDLEKVVLIGNNPNLKTKYISEIETRWLLIKGIKDKIFCLKSHEIEKEYPNDLVKEIMKSDYEIVDLEKRVKGKIKEIIDNELRKIFEQNIDKEDFVLDYEIKEKVDKETGEIIPYKEYGVICEAHLFGKNLRDDIYRTKDIYLGITQIDKGIISVVDTKIKYDLINDKFLNSEEEILRAFYNENEIKQILSYERYKNGIGSKFYSEIAIINEFVKDLKTITVKLKNGTMFKTDAILRNILDFRSNGKVYIARTGYQTIIEGEDFGNFEYKADQLESLRYGKTDLKINSNNFIINKETKENREIEEM